MSLGDWTGPRVFDEVNSLLVNVGSATLTSSTRSAILNDQTINAFALGVDGRWEIGQFRDAALQSPGVYKLTGFLRGSRGTEWAMTGHAAGEHFILLSAATLRRATVPAAAIGASVYYKAVTIGKSISRVTGRQFTTDGVSSKPYAPVDLRSDGSTATWHRRSRLSGRLFGSVPLGEATESYDVEIRSGSTLVRSATVNAPQYALTGLSAGTYNITVYQKSAAVGRGYPATASIPVYYSPFVAPVDALVLNFDGSTVDGAGVHTPVLVGDAALASGSYVGGGAVTFSGLGYVRVPQVSGSLDMAAGDFTFEAIFSLTDTAANQIVFSFGDGPSSFTVPAVALQMSSGNIIYALVTVGAPVGSGSSYELLGPTVSSGTTYHAAVQRRGDVLEFYFNGVRAALRTLPSTVGYGYSYQWGLENLRAKPLCIGGGDSFGTPYAAACMRGNVQAMRVKRSALYSGTTYTVPTTAF